MPCASSVRAFTAADARRVPTAHLTVSITKRQQKGRGRRSADGQDGADRDTGREAGPAWSNGVDAREAPPFPGAQATVGGFQVEPPSLLASVPSFLELLVQAAPGGNEIDRSSKQASRGGQNADPPAPVPLTARPAAPVASP